MVEKKEKELSRKYRLSFPTYLSVIDRLGSYKIQNHTKTESLGLYSFLYNSFQVRAYKRTYALSLEEKQQIREKLQSIIKTHQENPKLFVIPREDPVEEER
jgi:hypothetical protein